MAKRNRSGRRRERDTDRLADRWMRERDRLLEQAEGNYERSLKLMRSNDPQLSEDGFALLEPLARKHIEELMTEYRRVPDDQYWILELIADAQSEKAFDLLVEALDHEREDIRWRAANGLRELGSKEARRLLFERGIL
ncbi:HEAT repeat domain-containing protein [Micromonospora sp. WMMD1076]|uniref:HEAT repeat domain-containing protein n=1 Tax=Micromonospora sp. WMMD1076 TaxID=3016103 RepID=UPI002499D5D3|nr:HEAT repeat domain-containing protein [Micromonospora sp. WMMD1076]WFF08351.1 HEAT repeat domain-containing protein [Micromonospora sp. WMMD1076]